MGKLGRTKGIFEPIYYRTIPAISNSRGQGTAKLGGQYYHHDLVLDGSRLDRLALESMMMNCSLCYESAEEGAIIYEVYDKFREETILMCDDCWEALAPENSDRFILKKNLTVERRGEK